MGHLLGRVTVAQTSKPLHRKYLHRAFAGPHLGREGDWASSTPIAGRFNVR